MNKSCQGACPDGTPELIFAPRAFVCALEHDDLLGITDDRNGRIVHDDDDYVQYTATMSRSIEEKILETFGDAAPTGFGTGWWSGVLAVFFGVLAFGGVLCLNFPQLLSSPELRPYYPLDVIRGLIQVLILGAIVFGILSAILRKKKVLGLTGMLFALGASLSGGANVPVSAHFHNGPAIGLDWFLLDLFLMTIIFSPIEVLWPAYPKQSVFRPGWILDIGYFLTTHLPIQITSFLILYPATVLTAYFGIPGVIAAIGHLPWILQLLLGIFVADLSEYFIHLALHKVPLLWRFHSIHHSSKALDWIAGSRAHFVDDLLIRGLILIPMMFLFPRGIILAYLLFVAIHATWEHCNFGPTVKWLEPFIVQPRFHHWHHTSQKEALDKNFAVHFPWIDQIFGTYYLPKDKWPDTYGVAGPELPAGLWGQTLYPFVGEIHREDS